MGWLLEEFERAKARSAQVPVWARPVRIKEGGRVMANKLTIIYMDESVEIIQGCSFIKTVNGVLKFQVADTSYDGHTEGRPLANIKAYKVEGR